MATRALELAVVLALSVVLSSLQGCGNSSPSPTPTPSPAPPSPPSPRPDGGNGVMKGVAYGPVPLKKPGQLPNDDFFCDRAEPLWGRAGRGDLELLSSMGANSVRLYGNDPRYPHGKFLDEAAELGLAVIAGLSDYPYTQASNKCVNATQVDCYSIIKEQYAMLLDKGEFIDKTTKQYHSSLQHVILINEPDLKIRSNLKDFQKALISAFDGILDAEREAGVTGRLPKLTVTFSYAVCSAVFPKEKCGKFEHDPALGLMHAFEQAINDTSITGYTPKSDMKAAYKDRFYFSFNTANPASDIPAQFLAKYQSHFGMKPVYIGEFHKPGANITQDVTEILEIAKNKSNPLLGINFFEFQVRYDKGGTELDFGMFGLGDKVIGQVPIGDAWINYTINCLEEVSDKGSGIMMPTAVALAYGGKVPKNKLCPSRSVDEAVNAVLV